MAYQDIDRLINPNTGLLKILSTVVANLSVAIENNETLIELGYDNGQHYNLWERLVNDITEATNILVLATRYLNKT